MGNSCEGRLVKKNVGFKVYGEALGKFLAEVCEKCGEEVFDEATSDLIDIAAKKKGLWGLESHKSKPSWLVSCGNHKQETRAVP